jgi:cellulose synthase/poly-beta-1,6-N-acetylglucosamine synthase-like glycosyltransferase
LARLETPELPMTPERILEVLFLTAAVLIAIPLAVLVVESVAALLPRRKNRRAPAAPKPRCAVLVPAHDEEASIARTVKVLLAQLGPGDRLVVVADNCSDRTAEVARGGGATVVERHDPARRGKGYALDYGVRFLESDPPDVVLLVDADCTPGEGAVARLAHAAAVNRCPVQAAYLMDLLPGAGIKQQVSRFAFRYKNLVRPLGLASLGLPCLLTGTGIAFPWPLLRDAPLASGNIVEDMQLGLDLALAGHPPQFCPEAVVTSELPAGRRTAATQRTRWEHGHLRTLLSQAPRLVVAGLGRRRLDLLGLALELSVPPLSMLFLLWAAAGLACGLLGYVAAAWLPALVLGCSGLAAILSVFAAWCKFGREHLPLTSLLAAPVYALWKVPIYAAFFLRPQRAWVRTARTPATAESPRP